MATTMGGARIAAILVSLLPWFLLLHQASALTGSPSHDQVPFSPGPVVAVAVDLGNTNSCIAGYGSSKAETIFQLCIPSWVALADDGSVLVGEDAKNHAATNPEAAVFGFKRLLGKRRYLESEEEDVRRLMARVPYKVVGSRDARPRVELKTKDGAIKELSADEITATVLIKLKEAAEVYLGRTVQDAVFTVPQYYNDPSREATVAAAELAGLRVVRMVDEPTAAVVAHGLHRKLHDEGNALVLHVGGGTSDASVLTYVDGVFDFIGAEHDPFLGGHDFEDRIVDHFTRLVKKKHGKDINEDKVALWKLRTACEHAKKELSNQDDAQLSIRPLVDGVDFSESLTRAEFEEMNHDLFLRSIALVDSAMRQAELDKNKDLIDEIVLVGGSTMIPKIRKLVKDYFDGREIKHVLSVKPDEAVTFGGVLLSHPRANGYPCMGDGDRHQRGYSTDWCFAY